LSITTGQDSVFLKTELDSNLDTRAREEPWECNNSYEDQDQLATLESLHHLSEVM
jgi:hypothetical protein